MRKAQGKGFNLNKQLQFHYIRQLCHITATDCTQNTVKYFELLNEN